MGGIYIVMIVAIVFGFVYSVVKLSIDHSEKLARMRHGYPLKDGTVKMEKGADVIDYRGAYGNEGYNQSER